MITFSRELPSAEATVALGHGLADVLMPGDTLRLEGDLGAGKTFLTRAIAERLGVDPRLVSSPTFVVINQYPAASSTYPGLRLVHIDAYRLTGAEDLDALGWDRYFEPTGAARAGVIALVEWPQRLGEALPEGDRTATATIEATGTASRRLTLRLPDAWRGRALAEALIDREPTRCRVTGRWVASTSPTYPFADERARLADLNKWFTGAYTISREMTAEDEEERDPGAEAREP